MTSRFRFDLRLLALLPLLLAFVACSDKSSAPVVTATATDIAADPVTITWAYWGDDWEAAVNQRMLRVFEREYPQIKVRTEHRPWGQYFSWLKEEWRAGRSPDVMFLNYIPTYAAMGELEPLDRFAATDAAGLSDFYPALLDGFRANGTLFGLPRDNDTKVIYYNKAHFAEAGLPVPKAGWTWEDLRRTAAALTVRDANSPRYGFGFEPDYWWLVWMWQNGGEVLDDPMQPGAVLIDSPANTRSVQFLQDLVVTDRVTPPAAQLNTDDMNKLFREGKLSMVFGNHALVPWFANAPNLAWDVAPLPQEKLRVNVAGGAGFTISRRSEQKDAAWQLVRFLTSPKAQAILSESGLITPARRSVREDSIFMRQQPYQAGVFLAETEIGRPIPNFPGVTELFRVMDDGLKPVWRGERPAADVLEELAPKVREAIGLGGS